jgi:hypothetical protein
MTDWLSPAALQMPRLLNYVVAAYLILVGAIGLNNIYHFIRCGRRH